MTSNETSGPPSQIKWPGRLREYKIQHLKELRETGSSPKLIEEVSVGYDELIEKADRAANKF